VNIAPSTPTLSIAAAISSPVTVIGQFGTLCQGRFGMFALISVDWESMISSGSSQLLRQFDIERVAQPCPGP